MRKHRVFIPCFMFTFLIFAVSHSAQKRGIQVTPKPGKAIYLYEKGVDGIVDISPFTCMNGIVSEAVYPRVSTDHENMPIRNFYFDGTQTDLENDLGIFMELVRNYHRKKTRKRIRRKVI